MDLVRGDRRSLEYRQSRVGEDRLVRLAGSKAGKRRFRSGGERCEQVHHTSAQSDECGKIGAPSALSTSSTSPLMLICFVNK